MGARADGMMNCSGSSGNVMTKQSLTGNNSSLVSAALTMICARDRSSTRFLLLLAKSNCNGISDDNNNSQESERVSQ